MRLRFQQVNAVNCLNKLVTSFFLQIHWIYEQIWECFLLDNFSQVINQCRISLNNINETILGHIAERVADQELEQLKERKVKGDKFVSNVYKARIDKKLLGQNKKSR